ncbi:DUF6010 family protein [Streptomyces puniciscabiei]
MPKPDTTTAARYSPASRSRSTRSRVQEVVIPAHRGSEAGGRGSVRCLNTDRSRALIPEGRRTAATRRNLSEGAGAGAACLSGGGPGGWEFVFTAVATWAAHKGLDSNRSWRRAVAVAVAARHR